MPQLGNVNIYIDKNAKMYGIALIGENGKPIGAVPINPIRPADGDWVQLEFSHKPEGV